MGVIIVSQATGQHGWSSLETYEAGVRGLGRACSLFQPRAEWGAASVQDDDGLVPRLLSGGDEPLLLCGFDWHSQPLHGDGTMRRALRAHRGPRIGLFQEHLGADWIAAEPALTQAFVDAALSACEVLTHVACNHEGDVEWLRRLGVRLPILFLPFSADLDTFRPTQPLARRDPRAFFRGKRMAFMDASPYAARERMAALLRDSPLAIVADLPPSAQLDRAAMIRSYVDDLNRHQIQLNLPSVSDSLTCRPFEVLACGGTLVQTEPDGEISRSLLPTDAYVRIERDRPESVLEAIEHLQAHPEAAARLARRGHELVQAQHGADTRMAQLLDWVTGQRSDAAVYRSLVAEPVASARPVRPPHVPRPEPMPRIAVDLVFYQYANTGIAQVWNRVLAEWADSGLAHHVTLLQRRGSRHAPPDDVMSRFAVLPLEPHGGLDDPQQVQAACDSAGATVFLSTYYSRPTHTRSLLLVHDCIPERLNPDCHSEEAWREKRDAIDAASAYACVSQETAKDLVACYGRGVSGKPVYVTPNEFGSRFAAAPAEACRHLVDRLGLRQDVLLVVGERVGYRGYKNVEKLCQALGQLARDNPSLAARHSLLFVGGAESADDWSIEPQLEQHLSEWHLKRVTLDDEDMVTAFSTARFVLYPSLIEGFGLPPGEAAMCGTPAIAWDTAINREIYGDALAYLRDGDVASLARQVAAALADGEAWRARARTLGERLRQQRAQRGGASQSGTLLECSLLHAQVALDVADARYRPVLFDAHPSQRAEWLQRLLLAHPACRDTGDLGYGRETLASAALVSMYRGASFVAGCVDDLVEQTAFEAGQMEVILVDSASPDDEHRLIAARIARHRNLLYVRSVDRESLYRAWNRAAAVSRARHLSNANLDDRHRKDFFERLSRDLDEHPEVQLVYPAQYLSPHPNEPFREHRPERSWAWPDYTLEQLRIGNHVGSQPMWRRSLHQRIGWFEERYRIAGDYDFWCRIAHRVGPLRLHPVHVGLYYFNGTGIEHGDPLRSEKEVAEICRLYGIHKNYETSDADRERAAAGAAAARAIEDLQYNGFRLDRTINVWIDATDGLDAALRLSDSVLSQAVANHHRLRLVFVNPRWDAAELGEQSARRLASLTREWRAACRFDPFDFEEPHSCTLRLRQALPEDRQLLERTMQALYAGEAHWLPLPGVHGTAGEVARSAHGLRMEATA
jgi:glycosyltransferase involved in cell wall biosynthesis